jgi:hypothetical protein
MAPKTDTSLVERLEAIDSFKAGFSETNMLCREAATALRERDSELASFREYEKRRVACSDKTISTLRSRVAELEAAIRKGIGLSVLDKNKTGPAKRS